MSSWIFGDKPKVSKANGNDNRIREDRPIGLIISDLIEVHLEPLKERIAALEERLKNGN